MLIYLLQYFDSLAEEITTYSPLKVFGIEEGKLDHVNIQLVGQVGSGKSSFINTFDSCFRGHPSVIATAGSRGKSVTLDVSTIEPAYLYSPKDYSNSN